ncbi:MAG: hypothetical protein M3257_07925 [Actinomycetota bacterium]|nr:hypothetical protein [Actinomycetota bacterium]
MAQPITGTPAHTAPRSFRQSIRPGITLGVVLANDLAEAASGHVNEAGAPAPRPGTGDGRLLALLHGDRPDALGGFDAFVSSSAIHHLEHQAHHIRR